MTPIRDINPICAIRVIYILNKERNRTSIPVFPPYAPAFSPVSVWNCACPKPIAQSRFAHRCGQAGKKHILLQFLFSCPFVGLAFIYVDGVIIAGSIPAVAAQRQCLGLEAGRQGKIVQIDGSSFARSSLTSAGSSTRIFFPS